MGVEKLGAPGVLPRREEFLHDHMEAPQLPYDDLAGGLQVPPRLGIAAREAGHCGVESQLSLLGARGQPAAVQLDVEAVEDEVGAQRLERGRDRLKGVDPEAARLLAGE